MEELVWSDSKVLDALNNDVILISLYLDDKKVLLESEKYVSQTNSKDN